MILVRASFLATIAIGKSCGIPRRKHAATASPAQGARARKSARERSAATGFGAQSTFAMRTMLARVHATRNVQNGDPVTAHSWCGTIGTCTRVAVTRQGTSRCQLVGPHDKEQVERTTAVKCNGDDIGTICCETVFSFSGELRRLSNTKAVGCASDAGTKICSSCGTSTKW